MQPETKKIRHVRLPVTRSVEIQDEGAHLWAVSYADFLMVLMCFFILFFSTDEGKRDSVLKRIGQITQVLGAGETQTGTLAKAGSAAPQSATSVQNAVKSALADLPVVLSANGETLTLLLGENMYEKGEVFPTHQSDLKVLNETLTKLKPYQGSIEITFVGHTDLTPVSKSHGQYLNDNFDLSSLRATRVLQYAVHSGFMPEHLTAQGSAGNVRQSRTLSLVIRPWGKPHE